MDLNLEPVPENPVRKKQIAIGVAAISVLALLISMFTHRWLAAGGEIDAGFSPLSMKVCGGDTCESTSNKTLIDDYNRSVKERREMGFSKAEEKSSVFWIAGYAILLFGLLSVASLIAASVMVAQGKFWLRPVPPTSAALIFLMLALLAGLAFLVSNPTKGTGMQFGASWGFALFGAGVVLGITAAQMLVKFKPAEPELPLY